MTREEQSETEKLKSQLEFIASNRASRMFKDTIREYEDVVNSYGLSQEDAIKFLRDKYDIP